MSKHNPIHDDAIRIAETAAPEANAARFTMRSPWPFLILIAPACWMSLALSAQILVLPTLIGTLVVFLVGFMIKIIAACHGRAHYPTLKDIPKADLPMISILVPLHNESAILPDLIGRLANLEYPKGRCEFLFLCEASDPITQRAFNATTHPTNFHLIICPKGDIQTKPRAMNYAIPFCRGEIIGIYDAEDAPERDQLRKVAAALAPDQSADCVQARLDYFNQNTNWITRCFTIEYALYHHVIIHGLHRLNWPIPLSGTSAFMRRSCLEKIGLWDAHNVTEDAELGLRLYRHGYHVAPLDSVTYEEANHRLIPWIKQRSRWMKGFYITWISHMRQPRKLIGDIGGVAFIFVTTWFFLSIQTALIAPPLLVIGTIEFLAHQPVILPRAMAQSSIGFWGILILTELVNYALIWRATRTPRHRVLRLIIPSLILYWPLKTLAAIKAGYEVLCAPSYWDKTSHAMDISTSEVEIRSLTTQS